jgi:cyclophilin family peptidyl-prolyl cis-trans isomerase
MPSSSALSRRKGGGAATQRPIPWAYVSFVLVTMVLIFCFLYVQSLNKVLHHPTHPHHSTTNSNHQQQPQVQQLRRAEHDTTITTTSSHNHSDTLVLATKLGHIQIHLRPDLSLDSVKYIQQMVETGKCPRCTLYRAEDDHGIVQGILQNPIVPIVSSKGDCPLDLQTTTKYKDNCHGPIMTHGMVGWAGGDTGPDFFIDWYPKPATFWGAQHTVWGQVNLQDEETLHTMEQLWTLPTYYQEMTYLKEPIPFTMSIIPSSSTLP